jgi:hypothetical protein
MCTAAGLQQRHEANDHSYKLFIDLPDVPRDWCSSPISATAVRVGLCVCGRVVVVVVRRHSY